MSKNYNWDKYKNPDEKKLEDYGFIPPEHGVGMNVYLLKNGEVYIDPSNICAPSEDAIVKKIKVDPWNHNQ